MGHRGLRGQTRLRSLLAGTLQRRQESRGCLLRRQVFSKFCYGEAASWIQSFLIAVLLLAGLYGLVLFFWTSQ